MNAEDIKKELTESQIIQLVTSLGSPEPKFDNEGNHIYQSICHHSTSYKLYYYINSKMFHCYVCGENFDVYALVQKVQDCNFLDAFHYVCNTLNIRSYKRYGFQTSHLIDDWDLIQKYSSPNIVSINNNHLINQNIMNLFHSYYHTKWTNEGIDVETLRQYGIKFDISQNKIIIPHYDLNGNLIGIRGRALDEFDIEKGKYRPIYIEGEGYEHQLAFNLYGLNISKETIQRTKKVIIYEGEKSCLITNTMFPNNNFSVATCGSSITNYHRDILLKLGVREVFIAYDKEYEQDETKESSKYADKILKLAHKFSSVVRTYVLWDTNDLLNYKDSPCDKGVDILKTLMKNKFEVKSIGEE